MTGFVQRAGDAVSLERDAHLDFSLRGLQDQADQKIFWLLIVQWAVALAVGFGMATQSAVYDGDTFSLFVIGTGALTVAPLWMLLQAPGLRLTRWTVVVSQGCMSALLWWVWDGRVETQAHLLAWVFALSWYRDPKFLLAVSAVAFAGDIAVAESGQVSQYLIEDQLGLYCLAAIGLLVETGILVGSILRECHDVVDRYQTESYFSMLQDELRRTFDIRIQDLTAERDQLFGELESSKSRCLVLESACSDSVRELTWLRNEFARRGPNQQQKAVANGPEIQSCGLGEQVRDGQHLSRELMSRSEEQLLLSTTDVIATRGSEPDTAHGQTSPSQEGFDQRALLVIRNPGQKFSAQAALNSAGYSVDVAANGPSAYYSIMLHDYDLILVDADLPGEEGYDTLEAIRLLPPDRIRKSNSVYALTNDLTPDQILRCTNVGVDGVLLKPLKVNALRQKSSSVSTREIKGAGESVWCWNGAGLAR